MIDMRKRFRGNLPVTLGTLEKTEAEGEGYQLYAGKAAFSGGKGTTDGTGQDPKDWREAENEKYRQELAGKQGKQ
jgi:cytochrome c oxidase assembly factor 5